VTAVDTNILVYAHVKSCRNTEPRTQTESLAEDDVLWAIPVFCLAEFVRVITHPQLFETPHQSRMKRTAL
jgi:predicted nucleic acid-binding protein